MTFLNRVAPVVSLTAVLLTPASGFAGNIGSLAEANIDTSTLISTDWGIAQGSYVLSFSQVSSGGRAAITVVAPSATVTGTATPDTGRTTESPAPIFITQPNLGFQVILTADYTVDQGPGSSPDNPGSVVLFAMNTPSTDGTYTISPTDTAATGVSSQFVGAPIETNEVSGAGTLYAGDNNTAPTVLTADANPGASAPGETPVADPSNTIQSEPTSPTAQLDGMAGAAALSDVPEPSTALGVSLALIGLGWIKHRSKKG